MCFLAQEAGGTSLLLDLHPYNNLSGMEGKAAGFTGPAVQSLNTVEKALISCLPHLPESVGCWSTTAFSFLSFFLGKGGGGVGQHLVTLWLLRNLNFLQGNSSSSFSRKQWGGNTERPDTFQEVGVSVGKVYCSGNTGWPVVIGRQ